MAMVSLTKIRTMNGPTCGGLGFVPDDDDDHEEVIKTWRDLPHSVGGKP
jgi:hypothetical protein